MGRSDRINKPYEDTANVIKQNETSRPKSPSSRHTHNRTGNRNQRGPSKIICFHCSGEGHIASRCPLKEQGNQENFSGLH